MQWSVLKVEIVRLQECYRQVTNEARLLWEDRNAKQTCETLLNSHKETIQNLLGGQVAFSRFVSLADSFYTPPSLAWESCCWEHVFSPLETANFVEERYTTLSDTIPYPEALLPFVQAASKKLYRKCIPAIDHFSSEAIRDLERSLLARLSYLSAFTVHHEVLSKELSIGSVPDPVELFSNYPLLARFFATTIEHWITACAELICRFAEDYCELTQLTSHFCDTVTAVSCDLSDPHNNGRTVAVLTLSETKKVVYKPRPLRFEHKFTQLLSRLSARSLSRPLRAPAMIDRGKYGWMEFIEGRPCESADEVVSFYTRSGALLCLAGVFGITDLHHENLIADRDDPIVIDLETALQPLAKHQFDHKSTECANDMALKKLENSFLRTGFLPRWITDPRTLESYDISALGAYEDQILPWNNWQWHKSEGKYDLQLVPATINSRANLPSLAGEQMHAAEHEDSLRSGYEQMWQMLCRLAPHERRTLLDPFHDEQVRFILRETSWYKNLIRHLMNPRFLANATSFSIELLRLAEPVLARDDFRRWWPLVQHELGSLVQLDVPYFRYDLKSETIHANGNMELKPTSLESPLHTTLERLNSLDPREAKEHSRWIRWSFEATQNERFSLARHK
jgi:type 2 lantibiotic biosynthesis protein LanM